MVEASGKVNEEKKSSGFGACSVCWELILTLVMMCPECQALFCKECQEKLSKQKFKSKLSCSNCRQNTKDFTRCRPIEQLIAGQILKPRDECEKHHMEKVYFCKTCIEPFCPGCILDDGLHTSHERVKLSELYEEKKVKLEEDMTKIRQSREDFKSRSKEMDTKIN